MPRRRSVTLFLLVVVAATVVFTTGLMLCVPPGSGPDELGHIQSAAFYYCEHRLPLPSDEVRSLHPPLYHLFLAAVLGVWPTDAVNSAIVASGAAEIVLPYERRVSLDLKATSGDPRRGYAITGMGGNGPLPGADTHPIRSALIVLWRTSGLICLVIAAWCLIRGMMAVGAADASLAALAAGATLLVPGFGSTFAALNNDQFALLFSTAGIAVVCSGVARGRLTTLRALAAGVLLACGLLSKATTVAPFAGCAVWVAFWETPWKDRIKRLAAFVLPGAAVLSWFLLRAFLLTGRIDVVRMDCEREPSLFCTVPPDLWGQADSLAGVLTTWLGSAGSEPIVPSRLLVLLGLAIPVVVVLGALVGLFARGTGRTCRVASGAFLAGLAVALAGLLIQRQFTYWVQGRYLQPLAMLGAVALFFGSRELFGRRARIVLASAVTLFAVMGLDLLHGEVIPRCHPPHDRYGSPDFAAYVDAGLPAHSRYVEAGAPLTEPGWRPDPEGTVLADPAEVRIRVPDLDPAGTYVAWVRLHAFGRSDAVQDFLADGLPLGGPHAPSGILGWRRFPIPRAATSDGAVVISARSLGSGASIAELLVTRLPVEVAGASDSDGGILVSLRSRAPERLPPLRASARGAGQVSGEPVDVVFGRDGAAEVRLSGARLPAQLLLFEPAAPWLDLKLAPLVTAAAERRGAAASPGIDVAVIKAEAPADSVLMEFRGFPFPEGDYATEVLDEHGRPVPKGRLALVLREGARIDASGGRFRVGPDSSGVPRELRYEAGAPFTVDRLRLLHVEPHVFDLPPG